MSSLRALAQKAKNRLKAISTQEPEIIQEEKHKRTYEEACLSARIQYAIISSQKRIENDPLYNKVKRMLAKNIDVENPLSQLIEHNIYDSLDLVHKEKYMYKLSKRYLSIKKQVLKEFEEEGVPVI